MSLLSGTSSGDPYLSPGEFRLIRDLLRERTGHALGDERIYDMERRLRPRVDACGLTNFADYYRLLRSGDPAESEIQSVFDLVTNSETYFFREDFQLRAFRDETVPKLMREAGDRKLLQFWSMGCSTGEEAYSIAITILELGMPEGWNVRVFGTDLSRKRIAVARSGTYADNAFRGTSPERRARFFDRVPGGTMVCSSIRAMCQFGQLNLLDLADKSTIDQVDAIFCRNVLIYFAEDARRRVIRMIYERLRPGGYLMLGHSESLLSDPSPFHPVHLRHDLVYQRQAASPLQKPFREHAALAETRDAPVRVLIVDDSALVRRGIRRVFEESGRISVVAEASSGDEALQSIECDSPEAITLDLEMPRMDGFTFLRIMMSRKPLPVIVISSHSQHENVFRALELGAIDFIEKPSRGNFSEETGRQLIDRVLLARTLHPARIVARRLARPHDHLSSAPRLRLTTNPLRPPRFVIAIAASTGGPSALLDVFSRLPPFLPAAVLVSQHMPPNFTSAFAARLDHAGSLAVREATDGERVYAQHGYVCPGGKCMELVGSGQLLRIRVCRPSRDDAYVPSADRLFRSVAEVTKSHSIGVVLTGMGVDGVEGAKAIASVRGQVVVESHETAVVDGMPMAVIRAGVAGRVLPLPAIGEQLAKICR